MKYAIITLFGALFAFDVAYAIAPEQLSRFEMLFNISLGIWSLICLFLLLGLMVMEKVMPSIIENVKHTIPEQATQQQYIKKAFYVLLFNTVLLVAFTGYLVFIQWYISVTIFTLLLVLYTTFTSRMIRHFRQELEGW